MNALMFDRIVENRLETCKSVLKSKNEEYASDEDRLHNFKSAARAKGVQPTTSWDGMVMKHFVSLWDIIDRMEVDLKYVPSQTMLTEKLGDIINYTLLLEGLIEDRRRTIVEPDKGDSDD